MTSQPILEPILIRLVLSPGQHDWAWLKLGSKSAQIEKLFLGRLFMRYEITKTENTL